MRSIKITLTFLSLLLMQFGTESRAQMVTMPEAGAVANNWIRVIVNKKGSWGEAENARVIAIEEFKENNRILGYFCTVEPIGFIVVPLRKEFAPVKAYSATSNLDPQTEDADLLKEMMEDILDKIENWFGPVESARSADVSSMFEVDYRPMWDTLLAAVPMVEKLAVPAEAAEAAGDYVESGNYREGEELLTARWAQGHPYNLFCPTPPQGSDCEWDRCAVGCNATAGAMVLHYWSWPPYGQGEPYDNDYSWWNMPDQVFGTSPLAQIIAVAELSYEVGYVGQSDYCVKECATSSHIERMRLGYIDHFRYNSGSWVPYHRDYTRSEWFNIIKAQLNKNRPMTYGIKGHAIVCDGWQEIIIPPSPFSVKQFHMVWGHGTSSATKWYTLDVDWPYDPNEHLLADHYPIQSVGSTVVSGTYPKKSFPYWYFDQDATASFSTTFASGSNLQFLRRIRLRAAGYVRIESTSAQQTRIYTRGDPSMGIRMYNGTIKLYSGGSLKMH